MPRVVGGRKIYSAAEKAAYYKRKNAPVRYSAGTVSGRGAYKINTQRLKANYKKPYKYPGYGRKIGSAIGGVAGSYFGNPAVGSAIGGLVGQGAHSLMKTVTGFGDYNVSGNSLVYNRDAVPAFTNNNRCTMISHREFIQDISGSVGFESTVFTINPSNVNTFPWLSAIAQNYEEYVVQGMLFEFKTTCATAIGSTSTALGTVVLATQYNSLSEPFSNKQQMENYEFCQSTVPCSSVIHPVECDPKLTANQGLFYVQPAIAQAVGDPRLYNLGKFTIATVGMQSSNGIIGELWVTYKICFLKPKLQSPNSNIQFQDAYGLDTIDLDGSDPYGTVGSIAMNTASSSYAIDGNPSAAPSAERYTSLIYNSYGPNGITGPANSWCWINPDYVGHLQVTYQLHGATANALDPTIGVTGTCINLNTSVVGAGFIEYSKSYGNSTGNGNNQITFCLGCSGGISSNGSIPGFNLSWPNGGVPDSGGINFYGNLFITTIPSIIQHN